MITRTAGSSADAVRNAPTDVSKLSYGWCTSTSRSRKVRNTALLAAARAGKKVVALVELKARFDEEHNVGWARALEAAGAHVVYGFVGLKVHAKIALVVRRDDGILRRFAHVGTGNYNTRSGRQYTDLSYFSASDAVTSLATGLFNLIIISTAVHLSHGTGCALVPPLIRSLPQQAPFGALCMSPQ